jgi:lysozyme
LGYIDQPYQHGAVVTGVDGNVVSTVDGNSAGSIVRYNTRNINDFTCFYSIQKLLDEVSPVNDDQVLGVDVSAWQNPESMQWDLLFDKGFSFAYVRGVRGGKEVDHTAATHVRRAKAAGFDVGLYGFFSPFIPPLMQTILMRDAHRVCGVGDGDLAPALDIESYSAQTSSVDWVEKAVEILEVYEKIWGSAIRYHNVNDWYRMGQPEALERWPLWLADYTPPEDLPCLIWQYKSGQIHGYPHKLDQNIAHEEIPRIVSITERKGE